MKRSTSGILGDKYLISDPDPIKTLFEPWSVLKPVWDPKNILFSPPLILNPLFVPIDIILLIFDILETWSFLHPPLPESRPIKIELLPVLL